MNQLHVRGYPLFPRFILQGRLRYLTLFLHHDMSDLGGRFYKSTSTRYLPPKVPLDHTITCYEEEVFDRSRASKYIYIFFSQSGTYLRGCLSVSVFDLLRGQVSSMITILLRSSCLNYCGRFRVHSMLHTGRG